MGEEISHVDMVMRKKALRRRRRLYCLLLTVLILMLLAGGVALSLWLGRRLNEWTESLAWQRWRLPGHLVPVEYDLSMFPDIYSAEANTFQGNATIVFQVFNTTSVVILHSKGLNIKSYSLHVANKSYSTFNKIISNKRSLLSAPKLSIVKTFYVPERDYWVMKTKEPLRKGNNYSVSLQIGGFYSRTLLGLYRGTFRTSKNATGYFAAAILSPTSARAVFPCFDEPHLKAHFTLHLVHKSLRSALSNMPKLHQEHFPRRHADGDALMVTHFEKTQYPMSTYAVAFVITEDYGFTDHRPASGEASTPLVQILARNTAVASGDTQFAGRVSVKIIQYFNRLFGFPEPLKRIQMIALDTFISSALESWGLISYRSRLLLVNENRTQYGELLRSCELLGHELAHSWFGNIVTLKTWDDLWLNEGFATYFATNALNNNTCGQTYDAVGFNYYNIHSFLHRESKGDMDPIRESVDNVTYHIFRPVVYRKGSAVVSWIRSLMGPAKFDSALQKYIKHHSFKVATTDDLWRHMSEGGFPGDIRLMNSWLYSRTFPVVFVKFDNATDSLSISQAKLPKFSTDYQWPIWLQVDTSNNATNQIFFFNTSSFTLPLENLGVNLTANRHDWVLFNPDACGIYFVNYDEELWSRLNRAMRRDFRAFSGVQRANLINHAFYMAYKVNSLSVVYALDFIDAARVHGDNYWLSLVAAHQVFYSYGKYMVGNDLWIKYALNFYANHIDTLLNNPYSHNRQQKVLIVLGNLCYYAIKKPRVCAILHADTSTVKYRRSLTGPARFHLKLYQLNAAFPKAGLEPRWIRKVQKMFNSSPQEFSQKIAFLLLTRSTIRFNYILANITKLPRSQLFGFVKSLKDSVSAGSMLWSWMQKNCMVGSSPATASTVCDRLSGAGVVTGLVNSLPSTEYQLRQLQRLPSSSSARAKEEAVRAIEVRLAWSQSQGRVLHEWLQERIKDINVQ